MRYISLVILSPFLGALPCCTHAQLARNTVTQANTIADIHYRQILNNIAASEGNPDVLPAFAVVGTGATLIIDSLSGSAGVSFDDDTQLLGSSLGASGSRTFEDTWSFAPIVDPDKLRAMRATFQLTTHGEITDPEDAKLLESFLGPDYRNIAGPRWYGSGNGARPPGGACYSASCGDTKVWVMPDGLQGLSRLTLAILSIATTDVDAGAAQAEKQVQKYIYKDGVLDSIESYSVPDPAGVLSRPREDFYDPLQGQILLRGPP